MSESISKGLVKHADHSQVKILKKALTKITDREYSKKALAKNARKNWLILYAVRQNFDSVEQGL